MALIKPLGLQLAVLCLVSGSLHGRTLQLDDRPLIRAGSFLEELRGARTPESVFSAEGWVPVTTEAPNYGITSETIWLALEVEAPERSLRVFFIEDYLMDLTVYVRTGDGPAVEIDRTLETRASETRHARSIAVPIQFEKGRTRIWMRVRSDVTTLSFPLEIMTPEEVSRRRETANLLSGAMFGAFLMIALYNFFVHISTGDRSYRSYIFYVLCAAFFLASICGFIFEYLPLPLYLHKRTNSIGGTMYAIMAVIFTRSFLQTREKFPRLDRLLLIPLVFSGVVGLLAFLPWIPLTSVVKTRTLLALSIVSLMLAAGAYAWRHGYRPARFFTIAFGAFFAGTASYLLSVLGVLPHDFFSSGIQAGGVLEMALLSLALSDRINTLRNDLQRHVVELGASHERLRTSEEKYRTLVENTQDLIFSLDEQGTVLSVNEAVRHVLGYPVRDFVGRKLEQFLYRNPNESLAMDSFALAESMRLKDGKPVQLRLALQTRMGERTHLTVRLERIRSKEGDFILGKAAHSIEDELVPFLESERGRYSITSQLMLGHQLNQRITRNLLRFISPEEAEEVRTCVREIIINAIEHGNLGISFDEKTREQERGDYLAFLMRRQSMDEYRNMMVSVEYIIDSEKCAFRITDQGAGFDHRKMMAEEKDRVQDMTLMHGRGIAMARMVFDRVHYNDAGNQVVLIRKFRTGSPDFAGAEANSHSNHHA